MRPPQGKFNDPTDAKRQAAAAETPVPQASGRRGVLVVDDEHLVRIMVQLCLERHGYDVWVARNGLEAIDLHRQHGEVIDVVLLDVCISGLDPLQTMRILRERNPKVLVCFMSSSNNGGCDELLQCNSAYFIAKPFRLDDLANTLRVLSQDGPELCPDRRTRTNRLGEDRLSF